MSQPKPSSSSGPKAPLEPWLLEVLQRVEKLSYGSVQIVVRDGRVVEIENTDKIRLNAQTGPKKPDTP